MKIETKYSINDTVVFLADNKMWTGGITTVYVTVNKNVHVKYDVKCVTPEVRMFLGLESNRIFKTKEDLVKSL